jgi:hypothetical protein
MIDCMWPSVTGGRAKGCAERERSMTATHALSDIGRLG